MIRHLDHDAINPLADLSVAVSSLRQSQTELTPPAVQLIIKNNRHANAAGPGGPIQRRNGSVTISHLSIGSDLNWRGIGYISDAPNLRGVVECNLNIQSSFTRIIPECNVKLGSQRRGVHAQIAAQI